MYKRKALRQVSVCGITGKCTFALPQNRNLDKGKEYCEKDFRFAYGNAWGVVRAAALMGRRAGKSDPFSVSGKALVFYAAFMVLIPYILQNKSSTDAGLRRTNLCR